MENTTTAHTFEDSVLHDWLGDVLLEDAHLIPETSAFDYGFKMFVYGVLGISGVVTNTVSICVLVRGKLLGSWTHGMILNLAITDLILCLNVSALYFPPAIQRGSELML